ncbi:hypothetical protein QE152_g38816 [Popillia japonica]|uniref:Uncharacterized protein n=1 Tax=Popillia japonica TaxID=7064 RepID=A0AAW1HVP2_POPJA
MALELLKKEEEFYKLNIELEHKTKQLKQEADIVMVIWYLLICIVWLAPKHSHLSTRTNDHMRTILAQMMPYGRCKPPPN